MMRAPCPRCGGRLRLIALIEEASVIERILRHPGLPSEIPSRAPRARHRFRSTAAPSCGRGRDRQHRPTGCAPGPCSRASQTKNSSCPVRCPSDNQSGVEGRCVPGGRQSASPDSEGPASSRQVSPLAAEHVRHRQRRTIHRPTTSQRQGGLAAQTRRRAAVQLQRPDG